MKKNPNENDVNGVICQCEVARAIAGNEQILTSILERFDAFLAIIKRYGSIQKFMEMIELFESQYWVLKEYLDINEAAAFINTTRGGMYALKRDGKLPCYRANGRVFFKRDDLIKFVSKYRFMSQEEIIANAKRTVEELKNKKPESTTKSKYGPGSRTKRGSKKQD